MSVDALVVRPRAAASLNKVLDVPSDNKTVTNFTSGTSELSVNNKQRFYCKQGRWPMKRNMQRIFYVVALLALSLAPVFAGEVGEAGEGGSPSWFPMLEVGGSLLGLVISALAFKIYLGMQGGVIGDAFKSLVLGIIAMTFGIAAHGVNELHPIMSDFSAELTLELSIYIGLVMIGIGVSKVSKAV